MIKKPDFLSSISLQMERISEIKVFDRNTLELVFQLFSLFFEKSTENESIGFTTLFSRIAYLGIQNNLPGWLIFETQYFRKKLEQSDYGPDQIQPLTEFGLYLIYENALKTNAYKWHATYPKPELQLDRKKRTALDFQRVIRTLLIAIEEDYLVVIDQNVPDIELHVEIDDKDFSRQYSHIAKYMKLPISLNLIDVTYTAEKKCTAKGFVIRPDFLLGVTSVSECFSSSGATSIKYLGSKLIPSENSVHMLVGNIVNFYLDELIHDPELKFNKLLQATFQLAPEMFSLMSDKDVKECLSKVKTHFNNLKSVVTTELAEANITKERSYLEPSFYSNEFGLQGRLDLFHFDEKNGRSDIVELKSGKLYQAHKYGLNENHYIQTLLYDLILESVYDAKIKSTNYILYSGNDGKRLRFAPKVRSKQLEAMRLRNSIILLEEILTRADEEQYAAVLSRLDPETIPEQYTFLRRDAKKFWEAYGRLTALEQSYYRTFLAFISKEFQLSKIGRHGIQTSNGLASLWLDPMIEKMDMFTILSHLELLKNDSEKEIPSLTLGFSERSNKLSKFRIGDITVLYPFDNEQQSVLSNQLFKCTILEIDKNAVTVRLRARQKNFDLFRKYKFWNIEADVLDSGYRKQYHGLYDFMISDKSYRDKILKLSPPSKPSDKINYANSKTTDEQQELIAKALSSKDYFLLWGPPGTGKTSVMIANLVQYYYEQTDKEIILLAYTNRAVDEICAAVHELLDGDYIRIGSRYSTGERYRAKLLSSKLGKVENRAVLLEVFANHRIFISTISSFQGKREMKSLKKFDVAIIDEASQLLEPMLVGMLASFEKYILIGDHKQLPAVVTQDEVHSKVKDKELISKSGLTDTRMSLFERMYRNCKQEGWDWAYGALTNQGRMHQDIVGIVSTEFYEGKLSILSGIERLKVASVLKGNSDLHTFLIRNRMIFVDTPRGQNITRKTNLHEAVLVSKLLEDWSEIYKSNSIEVEEGSFGVITPFRSQISLIKNQPYFTDNTTVSVDTIERYQGGSRDRIVISLAVSEANLLESISNVSEEGIDRKLNVALTRAREHTIILGNKAVLMKSGIYSRLIAYCTEMDAASVKTLLASV